jgi:hypothetical protein
LSDAIIFFDVNFEMLSNLGQILATVAPPSAQTPLGHAAASVCVGDSRARHHKLISRFSANPVAGENPSCHFVGERQIIITAVGLIDTSGHWPHAKAILSGWP